MKLNCMSACFTKGQKAVFNVNITKDNSERFLEGLHEYLRLWEESNQDND